MELTVHLDNDQIHDIIISSLQEYHKYLAGANWIDEEDNRIKIREAFEIVLEQYLPPSEYEEYMTKFVN